MSAGIDIPAMGTPDKTSIGLADPLGLLGRHAGRLEVSTGTVPAASSPWPGCAYAAEAYVPREPWSPVGARLSESLLEEPCRLNRCVVVGRIPARNLAGLRSKARAMWADDGASAATGEATEMLLASLPRMVRCESLVGEQGPALLADVAPTMTICPQTRLRVGLHIDDHDRQRIHKRDTAPGRLSINLGSGLRYFLYLPFDLEALVDACEVDQPGRDARLERRTADAISAEFLASYPRAPVLRIPLNPGEYYLAPTENLIHDGAAPPGMGRSFTFTVRGYFSHD